MKNKYFKIIISIVCLTLGEMAITGCSNSTPQNNQQEQSQDNNQSTESYTESYDTKLIKKNINKFFDIAFNYSSDKVSQADQVKAMKSVATNRAIFTSKTDTEYIEKKMKNDPNPQIFQQIPSGYSDVRKKYQHGLFPYNAATNTKLETNPVTTCSITSPLTIHYNSDESTSSYHAYDVRFRYQFTGNEKRGISPVFALYQVYVRPDGKIINART